MFESELTQLFFDHWLSVRQSSAIPRSEDYLDQISPRIAPHIVMFDCAKDDVVVRFQGTKVVERWGVNYTDQSWLASKAENARPRILANMTTCVSQPCGIRAASHYVTIEDKATRIESLTLPLAASPGRPKRLVMLSNVEGLNTERDGIKDHVDKNEVKWFDVGFGVPQHELRVSAPSKPS